MSRPSATLRNHRIGISDLTINRMRLRYSRAFQGSLMHQNSTFVGGHDMYQACEALYSVLSLHDISRQCHSHHDAFFKASHSGHNKRVSHCNAVPAAPRSHHGKPHFLSLDPTTPHKRLPWLNHHYHLHIATACDGLPVILLLILFSFTSTCEYEPSSAFALTTA